MINEKLNAIENKIRHDDYKSALFGLTKEDLIQMTQFNLIKSTNHQLNSITVNKIGLSGFDNKRWVFPNRIDTLAIGHHLIQNEFIPSIPLF